MATGLAASTDALSEAEYYAAVSATADFLHEEEGDHLPPDLELGDLFDEQSLGETEEAETPREPFATQGEYTIDFSYGDSTLKAPDFIRLVQDPAFSGRDAIHMLNQRIAMDYGRDSPWSRSSREADIHIPTFHLDFYSVVGRPLHVLSRPGTFFENIYFTLGDWYARYQSKHTLSALPFSLAGRTFRIGMAASREVWFIVMHPITPIVEEEEPTRARRKAKAIKNTAMQRHHAEILAAYIHNLFLTGPLVGHGVDASWTLGSKKSVTLTTPSWCEFQRAFMENWPRLCSQYGHDAFWVDHQPSFHAYDYGANHVIEPNASVSQIARANQIFESLRAEAEDEADSEADDSEDETASTTESIPPPAFDLLETTTSPTAPVPAPPHQLDTEDPQHPDRHGADETASHTTGCDDPPHATQQEASRAIDTPRDESEARDDAEASAAACLETLEGNLGARYHLAHVEWLSYALATDINCLDRDGAPGRQEGEDGQAMCMLADRQAVAAEYGHPREYTFYPLGFHPRYGNFSSARPPRFLRNLCDILQHIMSTANHGADVVSFGAFQAYSNIKRTMRFRAEDLLPTHGLATAALGLSPADLAGSSAKVRAKHAALRAKWEGGDTPGNPNLSRPFARERGRLEDAVRNEHVAYRMEQVVTVRMAKLLPRHRTARHALRPMLQIMRFFLKDVSHYQPVLRLFRPELFPGVLMAFATLFDKIGDELQTRYAQGGDQGLSLAMVEGVALLDRLGHYCLTGNPKVLPDGLLARLCTSESLRRAAWPFISPRVLNFEPFAGAISIQDWPRDDRTGRPHLLHTSALHYHYGADTAAARASAAWFGRLGGRAITSLRMATDFCLDLFREMWTPQMVVFMHTQLRRLLHSRMPSPATQAGHASWRAATRTLEAWAAADEPFSTQSLWQLAPAADGPLSLKLQPKTRADTARRLYRAAADERHGRAKEVAPTRSTWLTFLRAAIHASRKAVPEDDWVDAIQSALNEADVQWVPGIARGRITATVAYTLCGARPLPSPIDARHGSLKRKASEADMRMRDADARPWAPVVTQCIDLGCEIPFKGIPPFIQRGFDLIDKTMQRYDPRVRGHYQAARHALARAVGTPSCDLVLMVILTLTASSAPVGVEKRETHFHPHFASNKNKDAHHTAAALATRMLWYLRPKDFSTDVDTPDMLSTKQMTQKIEQKGVNNRVLIAARLVKHRPTKRETPQNNECFLPSPEEMLLRYEYLLKNRSNPAQFIANVFQSQDTLWVQRCASIIS